MQYLCGYRIILMRGDVMVAERIKQLREQNALTQTDLAKQRDYSLKRKCVGDGHFCTLYAVCG